MEPGTLTIIMIHCGAAVAILRKKRIKIIATESMVPCVARSSAAIWLIMYIENLELLSWRVVIMTTHANTNDEKLASW